MTVEAKSSYVVGGYKDSFDFNTSTILHKAGCFPIINTGSAVIRLVGNVALAVFNTAKTVGYGIMGLGQYVITSGMRTSLLDAALDSLRAVGINVAACAFAIFEAIPIIGNLPHWGFVFLEGCCNFGIKLVSK